MLPAQAPCLRRCGEFRNARQILGIDRMQCADCLQRGPVSPQFLTQLRIHSMHAGPTHLCGGAVGLLAVGLLSRRAALEDFLQRAAPDVGVLFGGSGSLLGAQVLALCALTAWSAAASAAVFVTLRRLGLLRQPLEVEVLGIDARVFESKQHKSGMALSVLQQAVRQSPQPSLSECL